MDGLRVVNDVEQVLAWVQDRVLLDHQIQDVADSGDGYPDQTDLDQSRLDWGCSDQGYLGRV